MRDYKRVSVYHLLDQLELDAYAAVRDLPASERGLVGMPLFQATTQATAAVIHGCMSRNCVTLLPYIEKAHALIEESGQHLRLMQRTNALDEAALAVLFQRQQSCARLLLQWRHTLLMNQERNELDDDGAWMVAEDAGLLPTAPAPQRKKKNPSRS